MIKSVNQIRLELAEIQANHKQLNSFFWGDFLRAYKENRLNYPLMGAFYPTSTLLRNQTQLQLRIYIADKLYKDWSNLNDIESDTLQTCRDIYNIMNNSTRWQATGRVQSCSVTKFINRGGDEVAGHEMTMNFLIRARDGVCGLPMGSYDFDQVTGSLCSPVQIYEDGILIDTIPSGGIYNVVCSPATQVIEDSLGNQLYSNSIPSGATETQVIQDSSVTVNSLPFADILAEGSLDIAVVDTFDNPVGSQVLAKYVIDNAEININSVNIYNALAEETVNLTVNLDGSPSGSFGSPGVWNVTSAPCADTTLEVNGTIEGTVVAGSTVDIQLSDSGGVVTPISVTQVGNDLQIVLPTSGTPIDSDAQAFLTATGLSSDTDILAVNTFVTKAKAQGIWNDLDKIYPFIGGTATSHRYNLKNALADGTFFGGVTHNANGVTFNGSTGYFDTGWATNAGNVYNRHFSQYITSQSMSTAWAGSYDGTNLFGLRTDQARTLDFVGLNSLYVTPPTYLTRSAIMCSNVESSTVGKIYTDGSLAFTNTGAINAGPVTNTVYVGALNFNGTASFFHNPNVRFATTGNKLTASQQAILNTLAREFNAILGR